MVDVTAATRIVDLGSCASCILDDNGGRRRRHH